MKNPNQLSLLRALVADCVSRGAVFTSDELITELRQHSKYIHVKTVMLALVEIFNQGLLSGYHMDEIDYRGHYVSFAPNPAKPIVRTMPQDKLGRVTVPKPILTSLGIGAYGDVFVTREPNRVLLSNIPLGSDSKVIGADIYTNTKLHLPKANEGETWTAKSLNHRIVEVSAGV